MYLKDLLGLDDLQNPTFKNVNRVISGDLQDDQRMGLEAQKEEYWHKRCVNAYKWTWALTFSNLCFQTQNLANPRSETDLPMNLFYQSGSVICISLMVYAYRNQKFMQRITYGVLTYLIMRNSFRIMDFEQTRESYKTKERWFLTVAG